MSMKNFSKMRGVEFGESTRDNILRLFPVEDGQRGTNHFLTDLDHQFLLFRQAFKDTELVITTWGGV